MHVNAPPNRPMSESEWDEIVRPDTWIDVLACRFFNAFLVIGTIWFVVSMTIGAILVVPFIGQVGIFGSMVVYFIGIRHLQISRF